MLSLYVFIKPAGIQVTYFPYQSGSLFAACVTKPLPPPSSIATANLLRFVIAFVLRSVGCTCNDVVDRGLDRHVARCCIRPVARGALSAREGYISAAAQYLVLFSVMVPSPSIGLLYLAPVIIMGTLYPYAKRFTNYPQLILGLALSSGIWVGSAIVKVDPMSLRYSNSALAFWSLIASYTVWTMISDTIYAFQDIRDDQKASIRALSVEHEDHIKPFLFTLAAIQIGLLACTAVWLNAGWVFYFGVLSTAILLLRMVWSVDLDSPDACW